MSLLVVAFVRRVVVITVCGIVPLVVDVRMSAMRTVVITVMAVMVSFVMTVVAWGEESISSVVIGDVGKGTVLDVTSKQSFL